MFGTAIQNLVVPSALIVLYRYVPYVFDYIGFSNPCGGFARTCCTHQHLMRNTFCCCRTVLNSDCETISGLDIVVLKRDTVFRFFAPRCIYCTAPPIVNISATINTLYGSMRWLNNSVVVPGPLTWNTHSLETCCEEYLGRLSRCRKMLRIKIVSVQASKCSIVV